MAQRPSASRRSVFTEGVAARACFSWDGQPEKPRPTKRCFPSKATDDINVFKIESKFDEVQRKREKPVIDNPGIRLFPEQNLLIFEGHSGISVDFVGPPLPPPKPTRKICFGIWPWQRRERKLSEGFAIRAGEVRYNRQRVKFRRQEYAEKLHALQQEVRHKPLDGLVEAASVDRTPAVGYRPAAPQDRTAPDPWTRRPIKTDQAILDAVASARSSELAQTQPDTPKPSPRPLSARLRKKIVELHETFIVAPKAQDRPQTATTGRQHIPHPPQRGIS